MMKTTIKRFYGENPKAQSNTVARVVNKHHFERLKSLLKEQCVEDTIVHGGFLDEENL